MTGGILLEVDASEAAGSDGVAGIEKIDGVLLASVELFGEIDKHGAGIALVPEGRVAEQDLIDLQGVVQIELDAGAVLKHFKTGDHVAREKFLFRVDVDVELAIGQIVVGTKGT